jgi:hypothetical protein
MKNAAAACSELVDRIESSRCQAMQAAGSPSLHARMSATVCRPKRKRLVRQLTVRGVHSWKRPVPARE